MKGGPSLNAKGSLHEILAKMFSSACFLNKTVKIGQVV
jgi:hypothetical protein